MEDSKLCVVLAQSSKKDFDEVYIAARNPGLDIEYFQYADDLTLRMMGGHLPSFSEPLVEMVVTGVLREGPTDDFAPLYKHRIRRPFRIAEVFHIQSPELPVFAYSSIAPIHKEGLLGYIPKKEGPQTLIDFLNDPTLPCIVRKNGWEEACQRHPEIVWY